MPAATRKMADVKDDILAEIDMSRSCYYYYIIYLLYYYYTIHTIFTNMNKSD